jgi:hypothetical protein
LPQRRPPNSRPFRQFGANREITLPQCRSSADLKSIGPRESRRNVLPNLRQGTETVQSAQSAGDTSVSTTPFPPLRIMRVISREICGLQQARTRARSFSHARRVRPPRVVVHRWSSTFDHWSAPPRDFDMLRESGGSSPSVRCKPFHSGTILEGQRANADPNSTAARPDLRTYTIGKFSGKCPFSRHNSRSAVSLHAQ